MNQNPKRPKPPSADDIMVNDLALDGMAVISRYISSVQEPDRTHIGAALACGASIQVRVTSKTGYGVKVEMYIIGPRGDVQLSSAGGEAL